MDNGQDNYFPPTNFNGNIFPFPMPFFPQQQQQQQQQYLQQNYNDEMMVDFNNNQFAYNMAGGVNLVSSSTICLL